MSARECGLVHFPGRRAEMEEQGYALGKGLPLSAAAPSALLPLRRPARNLHCPSSPSSAGGDVTE